MADLARAGMVDDVERVAPKQLSAASSFFGAAERFTKTIRTFERGHQSLQHFVSELLEQLGKYCDAYEDLRVTLQPTSVALQGELVYLAERVDKNMWFSFFADGIRQLTFSRQTSSEELIGFFEALALSMVRHGGKVDDEEDAVTQLWALNCQGISFVAVDTLAATRGSNMTVGQGAAREMINLGTLHELSGASLSGSLYAGGEVAKRVHSLTISAADLTFLKAENLAALNELPVQSRENYGTLFQVDESQRADLARQCDADDGLLSRYVDASLRALDYVLDPVDAAALSSTLRQLLTGLLNEQYYARAAVLISQVSAAQKTRLAEDLDEEVRAALSQPLVGEETVDQLVAILREESDDQARQQLFSILSLFSGKSTAGLVRILPEIDDGGLRRRLCDMLAESGDAALVVATEVLPLSDESVALDLLYLIGRIGGDKARIVLESATGHSIAAVRAEATRGFLAGAPLERASGRAKSALRDVDAAVRRVATEFLVRKNPAGAAKWLRDRVEQDSFARLEFAEKRDLYSAIARTGGSDVASWLLEKLNQRNLLNKLPIDHERAAAAWALGDLRHEPATESLDKLAKSRLSRGLLKEACMEALSSMGKPVPVMEPEVDPVKAPVAAAQAPRVEAPPPPRAGVRQRVGWLPPRRRGLLDLAAMPAAFGPPNPVSGLLSGGPPPAKAPNPLAAETVDLPGATPLAPPTPNAADLGFLVKPPTWNDLTNDSPLPGMPELSDEQPAVSEPVASEPAASQPVAERPASQPPGVPAFSLDEPAGGFELQSETKPELDFGNAPVSSADLGDALPSHEQTRETPLMSFADAQRPKVGDPRHFETAETALLDQMQQSMGLGEETREIPLAEQAASASPGQQVSQQTALADQTRQSMDLGEETREIPLSEQAASAPAGRQEPAAQAEPEAKPKTKLDDMLKAYLDE